MRKRLFGLETEFAFSAACKPGQDRPKAELVEAFIRFAGTRLRNLSDGTTSGFFTLNASRMYVDCGAHPELATPECCNPSELVRFQLAGEEMLCRLIGEFRDSDPALAEVNCFKTNVDYSGSGATFGSHESYLHTADLRELAGQMMPHLISRILFTAGGGFDPFCAGLAFTLSPRSHHLVHEISHESTNARGIFHKKNESLSRQYHRMHLLCGESLCSQTAIWLRFATTALVLALVEAGLRPSDSVQLRSPLEALRTFAQDPRCKAASHLRDGRPATALMLQRHYLAEVERHMNDSFMPEWAGRVCREWRRALDLLEQGPDSVSLMLDWAIKYALYRDAVAAAGFTWESLPLWNHVVTKLTESLGRSVSGNRRVPVDVILSEGSPVRRDVQRLTPWLTRNGLRWEDFNRFILMRYRILEMDTRFSQLGAQGIFNRLDRAGVLQHAIPDLGDVNAAMTEPPSAGRARLRSRMVGELPRDEDRDRFVCGWDFVIDRENNRVLDLSDPFVEEAQWSERRRPGAAPPLETLLPF